VQNVVPPQSVNDVVSAQSASSVSSTLGGDFGEEAIEIFRLEAEEHLQTISTYVAALEKDSTNRELIQGIRRATHTLKGAAAMMGFRAIAELSHVSEDLLDSIMEGKTPASTEAVSLILDTAETLDVLITGNKTDTLSDEARVQALRVRYANLLSGHGVALSTVSEDIDEETDEPPTDSAIVAGTVSETPETNAQRANRGDLSVRVRLQKLDELVNLFGELLVNRSVLEERIERLVRLVADVGISSNRLRDVGQKLESRFEAATLPSGRSLTVMPGDGSQPGTNGRNGKDEEPSHLADFDELEMDRYTEFHQVARGLSEGISDMATLSTEMDAIIRECEGVFARENRLSTTVQDRLMKTRLVPLSTMTPRLYRAARAVALKQRKEFEFLLEGEETEIDRTVFEEIAGPLLHLVRNAVNHGIETEEERIARGKPAKGQLMLSASYEGNQVVITVREDGRGIEPEQVRQVAIAHGLIHPEHVLSEHELIELIFRPGFSTAEVLSEESGRGVGLDVVRDSVSRLRGTIEVESTPGKGTAFTMKFPTSLAIQSAMMVRVSDQQFAVPIVMVESIGRLDTFKRTTVAGQPAVVVRNDLYPLSTLAQYLSLPHTLIDDKSHVLLVNTGGNRVALVIDEVRGKLDIVMKNLGPHLRHVYGVAGGTVLGNGQVVLVLELTELLSSRNRLLSNITSGIPVQEIAASVSQTSASRTRVESSPAQQTGGFSQVPTSTPKQERGKHVLVVDDSPSVRRVVGNMLKQHGWETQMARDGVEALEMIGRETPAAVLLDVEMPRMDGYELIATVRAQEQYRTLPLIMLTSRAAAKHQQRAMQLGATAYLVKPYQDEELLGILNSHVYGAVVS
jgi:chemotaxis protein histidine kinase CheA/CheY-like chemotaxis protein